MKKWAWVAAVSLAVVGAFLAVGREMVLVPAEEVRVVADIESINASDPSKVVAVLPAGQPVPITGCRNLSDDQVYRVKASSGVEGYVSGGRFDVRRSSWRDSLGKDRVVCY